MGACYFYDSPLYVVSLRSVISQSIFCECAGYGHVTYVIFVMVIISFHFQINFIILIMQHVLPRVYNFPSHICVSLQQGVFDDFTVASSWERYSNSKRFFIWWFRSLSSWCWTLWMPGSYRTLRQLVESGKLLFYMIIWYSSHIFFSQIINLGSQIRAKFLSFVLFWATQIFECPIIVMYKWGVCNSCLSSSLCMLFV